MVETTGHLVLNVNKVLSYFSFIPTKMSFFCVFY